MEKKTMEFVSKKYSGMTHTPTTYEYECYDEDVTWNGRHLLAEIKVRTGMTSTQINEMGGAYLEHVKCEGIRRYKVENDLPLMTRVLYIMHYWDSIVIYDLHTVTDVYKWEGRWLPKSDNDRTLVHKFVTTLSPELIIKTIPLNRKNVK